MSDVQNNYILKQRQMQQRQILAMMGIPQWVQPDSPTMNMADIVLPETILNHNAADIAIDTRSLNFDQTYVQSPTNQPLLNQPLISQSAAFQSAEPQVDSPVSSLIENILADELETHLDVVPQSPDSHTVDDINPNQTVEKTYRIDTLSHVSQVVEPLVDVLIDNSVRQDTDDSQAIITPFDLQGGRYGNWVLLVDIQALTSDSQKLWQNIIQALSLSCETSSFPICAGMDTAELANASLAGYIFKLGRREDIHVAALTALPSGLHHSNMVSVPTLDDILGSASLKRILWEKVSS